MSVSESTIGRFFDSDLGDAVERAAYTAAEAFLAVFVLTDISTLRSASTAAVAAFLSAAKTFIVQRRASLG